MRPMVSVVATFSTIRAAHGWLELGLPVEALSELRSLSGAEQRRPEVLRLRLAAEMEIERWNAASDTARLLCLRQPGDAGAYMQAAYCLHETGDTLAARDWLLRGPGELLQEPLFHYNIACYHAVLGERDGALRHLARAFEMDPSLREMAAGDEDLEELDGW